METKGTDDFFKRRRLMVTFMHHISMTLVINITGWHTGLKQ